MICARSSGNDFKVSEDGIVKVRRSGFLGVQSLGLLGRLKGPKSPGINVIALRLVVAHIKRLVVAHSKTFERAVT